MKGGKKDNNAAATATPEKNRRRPELQSADSEFEYSSRSTELTTPSLGAVPSLTNSTSPSEGPTASHRSHAMPTRTRQPQEPMTNKIRRFEGGGKLPKLGWKSLSTVSESELIIIKIC